MSDKKVCEGRIDELRSVFFDSAAHDAKPDEDDYFIFLNVSSKYIVSARIIPKGFLWTKTPKMHVQIRYNLIYITQYTIFLYRPFL